MKKIFNYLTIGLAATLPLFSLSCSKDDEPDRDKTPDNEMVYNEVAVYFRSVPANLIGGPTAYGANLYYGAENQITTGYFSQLNQDTYAQFSINYGDTYDANYNPVWGYSFLQGGLAISNWHNMTDASYSNQLSVYHPLSSSGGNFIVAFGYATDANYKPITNPNATTLSDYDGCGRVYITDAKGYTVANPGLVNSRVAGEEEKAFFKSVSLMNTTYVYKTMKDGNEFSSPLNEENKGWLKVQFISFDDNEPSTKPSGYVEAYLANFDPVLEKAAGYCGKIIDDWMPVDLSSLPETSILVINFVGSDSSDYGLNTPTYCALDNFVIAVEKD